MVKIKIFFLCLLSLAELSISLAVPIDNKLIQVLPNKKEPTKILATKGALIEAIFILQNKKNALIKSAKKIKIALMDADHLIKDLVYERQVLFDLYHNKRHNGTNNMIDRILTDMSVGYKEILNINLIKGLFPNRLKQIGVCITNLENVIDRFANPANKITFDELQLEIIKFDNILDILKKEEELLSSVLSIEKIKLKCKKFKDQISSRQEQLDLYTKNVVDKNAQFDEHKSLIEGSIKRINKTLSSYSNQLEQKQNKNKIIKQNLFKLCEGFKRIDDGKFDFGLVRFDETLEKIKDKLNRNFNIGDLA